HFTRIQDTNQSVDQSLIDPRSSQSFIDMATCEMALFAPVSGDQGVQETYQEAVSVLSSLEEEIKNVN
ncbi:MAG: hypothetical protein AAFY70_00630, partial [Bacteroidota bacterium]